MKEIKDKDFSFKRTFGGFAVSYQGKEYPAAAQFGHEVAVYLDNDKTSKYYNSLMILTVNRRALYAGLQLYYLDEPFTLTARPYMLTGKDEIFKVLGERGLNCSLMWIARAIWYRFDEGTDR
jgi:hypothetical protein